MKHRGKDRVIRVYPDNLGHMKAVLKQDGYSYQILPKKPDSYYYEVLVNGITRTQEDIIKEDMLCEKQRMSTESKLPVVSLRSIQNGRWEFILRKLHSHGYQVLEKDLPAYNELISHS